MTTPRHAPPAAHRPLRLARGLSLLAILGVVLAPRPARALDDDRDPVPRAAAEDRLAGRLRLTLGAELVGPVGTVAGDVATDDVAASGVGIGGAVGLGVSRQAELVLHGGFASLGDPARCSPCGGDTARVGLGLAYHLAQGVAIDPWARWGVGFRTTSLDDAGASNRAAAELAAGRYHGVDLTQLAVGATWSPASGFGLGPYLEVDLGTYLARPDGAGSAATYAFFTAGFAVQLLPNRMSESPAPATARSSSPPSF